MSTDMNPLEGGQGGIQSPALGIVGSWFLTAAEKRNVAEYDIAPSRESLTTRTLRPLRDWLVSWVPAEVAPNVLSLSALLCVVQAWYVCTLYSSTL